MLTNSKIKEIKNLQSKSKARREAGLFIIEGVKLFLEAPAERIEEVYITEDILGKANVSEKLATLNYEIVSYEQLKKISDTETPQGVLCLVRMYDYSIDEILVEKSKCLYMVLEDIQDPGNLGTIIRSGEAAGVAGIIMSKGTVDIYNPKVIRATMGSIYRVPFVYTEDIINAIRLLQSASIEVYAAHLKGEKAYDEIIYDRSAFLIGNEGNGLREETANAADTYIKIPMQGQVESLNAAIAATVLMFEHARQSR